jgi:DNA-directed RNA polymerase subunit RPC12/RpoP
MHKENIITCMKCGAKVRPEDIEITIEYSSEYGGIKDSLCPSCGKVLKDITEVKGLTDRIQRKD